MNRNFWLGVLAYFVGTMPIGVVWHLVIFADAYHELAVYRDDLIFPFGIGSMLIQGAIYSWTYPRLFAGDRGVLRDGLAFGLVAGLLAWTYLGLAVAAKHVMTSVPLYLALESGFTLAQFIVVGPLMALAHRRPRPAIAHGAS